VIVVQILRQQKEAGNQSGAGWKGQVWTAIEAALTAEGISKGGPKLQVNARIIGPPFVFKKI
jgi:hypothetical protein